MIAAPLPNIMSLLSMSITNLQGFVETLPPQGPEPEEGWGIFSLDCEMYYSSEGLELGKVTVVNAEHRVVFDTCVRPERPIADCITRVSGLTEALMKSRVTMGQVQNTLLGLINSNTILVGHSLENDLKAFIYPYNVFSMIQLHE
ncbi:putative exonuclease GOR [Homalodisca vitripennis]|uniref:putative exonuclease GOR n=1 Tax=Homalodisca vitripennis TaxID=197043 RepID=UPI001EECC0C2|nr:putative exonuclease GOR [Homalodisca vitripennis]